MKAGWYVNGISPLGRRVKRERVAHHFGQGYTRPVCGRKVTTNTVRDLRPPRVGDSFCMDCERGLHSSC